MSASIGESKAINNTNMCPPQEFENVPLPYDIYQPVKPNTWNGKALPISIHSSMKILDIDAKNMTILLLHMINFIKCQSVDQKHINFYGMLGH